jgi:hypothetical protein
MRRPKTSRTISFVFLAPLSFFLISGFALVNARAQTASNETPSRLSAFVHDFTTWVDHVTAANHGRVVNHSPPLPRPRPAERAPAAVASNQAVSEFARTKKKITPTPVQIRD